jgi:hypothetical protein
MWKDELKIVNEGDGPSHVCSLLHMYGFGEGKAAGYDYNSRITEYDEEYGTYDAFRAVVKNAALKLDKVNEIASNAMIVAYATTLQPHAQEYLRKAGFHEFEVPSFLKYPHGVSQFTLSIKDFCAWIDIPYVKTMTSGYVDRAQFLARWHELEGAGFTPQQIEAELGADPERAGANLDG